MARSEDCSRLLLQYTRISFNPEFIYLPTPLCGKGGQRSSRNAHKPTLRICGMNIPDTNCVVNNFVIPPSPTS